MCTAIKINYPQGLVMGRTMDLEAPVDYNVIYFPHQYPIADNLLGGTFPAKYRMLGVGFRNMDPLKDGVNEHGLIGVTNDFGGFGLYSDQVDPEKTNVSAFHFMNYVLANYRNVSELLEDLPNLHISSHDHQGKKVITPLFHYMFADQNQRCIVIEPDRKQLKVYENPYGIMTNPPKFSSHIKLLQETFDLNNLAAFNGAKHLPGGHDPKSRFLKAYYMSQMSLENETADKAMGNLYRILSAVSLPKGFIPNQKYQSYTYSVYLSAYDSVAKRLTIQAAESPMVYSISLDEIPHPDQRQAIYITKDFKYHSLV